MRALARSVPSFDLELLARLGRAAPSFVCCRYRAAYGLLGRQKKSLQEKCAPVLMTASAAFHPRTVSTGQCALVTT